MPHDACPARPEPYYSSVDLTLNTQGFMALFVPTVFAPFEGVVPMATGLVPAGVRVDHHALGGAFCILPPRLP